MNDTPPLFDGTFDAANPADAERFRRMVETLKVRVDAAGLKAGILLHKWLDERHIRVLVIDGTPQGRKAARALLDDGYERGAALSRPAQDLATLVARIKRTTEGA